jgi:hypothetical protein
MYLQIFCFINHLENTFQSVRHSLFLFDDLLVWGGVEQDDMRALYRYVAGFLHAEDARDSRTVASDRAPFISARGRTGFLTGPESLASDLAPVNAPLAYVGSPPTPHHLVMYQFQRATLLLLVEHGAVTDMNLYRALASYIDTEAAPLVKEIGEQFDRVRRYSLVDDEWDSEI